MIAVAGPATARPLFSTDSPDPLPVAFGTPEDVRAETIERLATAKQYGGMILMPCNRPVELPFENLVAYLQAAEEHCIV